MESPPRPRSQSRSRSRSRSRKRSVPYNELGDGQIRTKQRREKATLEFLQNEAQSKDPDVMLAMAQAACRKGLPRGRTKTDANAAGSKPDGSAAEQVIACQIELCAALKARNPYPSPMLTQCVDELRAEIAEKKGVPSESVTFEQVARRALKALTPKEREEVALYDEGRRRAKALRRGIIAAFVHALKPKQARDLGLDLSSNLYQSIRQELREPGADLTAVALAEHRNTGGRQSWEDKHPGIEGELNHAWYDHCRPAAGKKGRKGMMVIQGLKGDVALEILKAWNGSNEEQITRYLVEKSAGGESTGLRIARRSPTQLRVGYPASRANPSQPPP